MSFDYINEAFRKLNSLTEDTFDTSVTGINALSEFRDQDDETDIIKVIDPDADNDSQLADSYVGKVIINCNVCHSLIFENKEDVVLDEDGMVNPEMQCPYCGETSGFTVVGEITPFNSSKEEAEAEESKEVDANLEDTTPLEDVDDSKDSEESDDTEKLDESLDDGMNSFTMLKSFMASKGFGIPDKVADPQGNKDAIAYLWGVIDLFDHGDIEVTRDSLEQWLSDTKMNYPEDLLLFTECTGRNDCIEEGIFDKFKKKSTEADTETKKEEPAKEEPKEKEDAFTTYSYDEWIQALEVAHKEYQDGPEAGRHGAYDKIMKISPCENLFKDVVAYMDAYMNTGEGKKVNHKSFAKHLEESAFSGGYAEGGSLDTAKRAGGAKKVWKDALDGKKTRTVKAKDLKPGMITSTGEIRKVTDIGWMNGKPSVEVSYGGTAAQGSHAADTVAADRDYEVLDESLEDLSMTANDTHLEITEDDAGQVTVTMGPVTSDGEEIIAPVSDETMSEIAANNSEEGTEEPTEEISDTAEETDVDVEEVDEEGLDELGESFLKNTYSNVESFKTTSVSATDRSMIVEGVLTFNSGVKKTTGFVFEAKSIDMNGRVKFTGCNKHLSESLDAFMLTGTIHNKKLLPESLAYSYDVGKTKVTGTVNKR